MAYVKSINPASLRNLQAYIRDLPKKTRDVGSKTIREAAESYKLALEHAILTQDARYMSNYADLHPDYDRQKSRKGMGGTFWAFDFDLASSLTIDRVEVDETQRRFIVGFGRQAHPSGFTCAELAERLEFGYGVPARPLVQPVWEDNARNIKSVARKAFETRWKHDRYRG